MNGVTGRDVWAVAMAGYVLTMQAAARSPGTVRLHRHYLGLLGDQVRNPWSATPAQLVRFMAAEHWRPETRKSARGVVRSFYRWGVKSGQVSPDPSLDLPTVRVPAGRPRPTPEHVVSAVLAGADERLELMVMLAAYAGLRAAEIARVHASDLVLDTLTIEGKGGKIRAVPVLNPRLLGRLEGLEGWAFPNGLGSHLTPGHVSRLVSRAMPDDWTAHTLRHRMGTAAYRGTRDLLAVQQVLGHSRPETTQRYVLLPDDALRRAVAATELAS